MAHIGEVVEAGNLFAEIKLNAEGFGRMHVGTKVYDAQPDNVLGDHARLVRELDVLLNGPGGAARQASLCDIVSQVQAEGIRSIKYKD